ncbi:MAG TPA: 5-formyltetrahydrofolate cyclo-ligase [Usitatibacteraceae bacterium]
MTDSIPVSLELGAVRAQKKLLREQILARRDALAPVVRSAASREMTQRLLAEPGYIKASAVLAYMSFGTEVDTAAFVTQVLHDGKLLALPRIHKPSQTLRLHRVNRLDELMSGVWGIREPHGEAPAASLDEIDFVLMPGVAFDGRGARLGYGAGYYDRLLAGSPRRAQRVAAAFDVQIVDAVPDDAHDQRLDIIISEDRIIHVADKPSP